MLRGYAYLVRVAVALEHSARVRRRTADLALNESGIVDAGRQSGGDGREQEEWKEGNDGADERLHRGGRVLRQGRDDQGAVEECCRIGRDCVAAGEGTR